MSRSHALDVLAVELLDHRAVLVSGDEPLVELGVHRRLEVRRGSRRPGKPGVRVGRDDDVRRVALVDAFDGTRPWRSLAAVL